MRRSSKPILIASRRSKLAQVQAKMVGNALAKRNPKLEVSYIPIESKGDRIKDTSLSEAGGKGLFTKQVEQAVLDGKADIAVHSLKDLPAGEQTSGLSLAAITKRGDVRDCLISKDNSQTIEELKENAILGTASPRRAAQVLSIRPDIKIKLIRGNVETRINKVLNGSKEGEDKFDATLLSRAGLLRSKLKEHAKVALPVEKMLPAAGQGALGIQCRADDHNTIMRLIAINDQVTAFGVNAERLGVDLLGADCHSPIAILAQPLEAHPLLGASTGQGGNFRVRVKIFSYDGKQCLEADDIAQANDISRLVENMVKDLIARGAKDLIAKAKKTSAFGG